jgi:hypothetical protein
MTKEKRPVRLAAKQAPHWPGISRGARFARSRGDDVFIVPQTTTESCTQRQLFAASFTLAGLGDVR